MEVKNWFAVDGDNTLALNWDLNENSHVWEIGGFEGRWAQQIWNKYQCHIDIFEPQEWAVERMQRKFEGIDKVEIHPYGLWTNDVELVIADYFTDGASVIKQVEDYSHRDSGTGRFRNIHDVISERNHRVDVALMNIEGAEYVLIPELTKNGNIRFFKNFWCQFHPGLISDSVNDQFSITQKVFDEMERTHELLWNCFPTAVAWRLKE